MVDNYTRDSDYLAKTEKINNSNNKMLCDYGREVLKEREYNYYD